MCKLKIMPSIEDVKHLQIPLQDISSATNRFSHENFLGKGGFGMVYKGTSELHGHIAVKRLDRAEGQGDREFKTEIALLSKYKHENIVSLLGFCDENCEKILVYKYESNGSLDKHLDNKDLTWTQRLQICLEVARGLNYLHSEVGPHQRILHRDVKSSNILLDGNWKPKISDFGLSRIGPANMQSSFLFSDACGTRGYVAPEYGINDYLTQKADVYSFGVVLWEVLCGRLSYVKSYKDERRLLTVLAQRHYTSKTLDKIIPSDSYKQINTASLRTFSNIAYQCLKNGEERPTMKEVVEQLQKALDNQLEAIKKPEDGKKAEEEAKTAAGDEKKGEESPLQEVVLRVFMHCEDCARKVRQSLKGFEGVDDVDTDCETRKVVVKGKQVDPLKVLERVQKKTGRNVTLISPVPKPSAEEPKPNKPKQEEPPEQEEEKKDEYAYSDELQPPSATIVVLKVHMHCEDCARRIRNTIQTMKGVESVVPDINNSQVVVKGTFREAMLLDYLYNKTSKKAMILKQDPYPKTEEAECSISEQQGRVVLPRRRKGSMWVKLLHWVL